MGKGLVVVTCKALHFSMAIAQRKNKNKKTRSNNVLALFPKSLCPLNFFPL